MDITIRPKNFKLQSEIEEHMHKRLQRFQRLVDDLESTEVVLAQQPTKQNAQRMQYVAQFTLHTRHNIVRSEVCNDELLTAVDQGIDHLGKQLERRKTRMERRKKGGQGIGKSTPDVTVSTGSPSVIEMAAPAEAASDLYPSDGAGEDDEGTIVRTKRFSVKPMHPEEAVEQMDMLGHNFFVFWNAEDERVSVVYRRNDGNYGLIEPEFG